MTQTEFIDKINDLIDMLENDFLDSFEIARLKNELISLKYEYFMNKQ